MEQVLLLGAGAIAGQVVAMFSRPFERFLERRLADQTTARTEEVKERVAGDPSSLRDFLMLQILEITFVSTLFGILAGLTFAAAQAVDLEFSQSRWLYVAGQIVAIVGAIFVLRIASLAIRVGRAVWGREA